MTALSVGAERHAGERADAGPLLEVSDLTVAYRVGGAERPAVRGLGLTVRAGETVAVVGESGSGKSTLAHTVNGMLPDNGRVLGGRVHYAGRDVLGLSRAGLRALRGAEIALVPQDPGTSLNPTTRVGRQVAEALRIHRIADRATAAERAVELLERVGIDRPGTRARQFPHELSGGMRQRVLIAIALAAEPRLLIADEPTSALDATVSRRVLDHLATLRAERGIALLLITHDLAMAAERADRIAVLRGGLLVEEGPARRLVTDPGHPYTRELLADTPSLRGRRLVAARERAPDAEADADPDRPPLLRVRDLVKDFGRAADGGVPRAVDGVGFDLARGRTLGVLGESGSGKTTTARILLGLERPDTGSVRLDGTELTTLNGAGLRAARRRLQIVQQNPYASLDPRFTVRRIIDEPLRAHRIGDRRERAARVAEMLEAVALSPELAERRPRELSGGQRQRVAIARALVLRPDVVVCDEPVSALDVTVQAQILDLLTRLQRELGIAYVFISHDLAVVRQISDDVMVMRGGAVLEHGPADELFERPRHPYTRELLASVAAPFPLDDPDGPDAPWPHESESPETPKEATMPPTDTVHLAELLPGADPSAPSWPALRDAVTDAEARGVTTLVLPAPGPTAAPVEATTVAAAVLRATAALRVVVPFDPERVAPYNAARVLGTLAYLGPDRVLVTPAAPPDGQRDEDGDRWADWLAAVLALWESFPRAAIVADRATGRYFDAGRLDRRGHRGPHHTVAGPLNLPRPPGDAPRVWPDERTETPR
ncbi:dipeptide ABC transporter ATP-binding protein [Streptomyces radicis]|uniref:Dipeptide ABC transporter ATP-binding protein n=1 Tax=Streptomyces radicis TaxID=1750517 RepID=A0A3A9VUB4_9ACTN|nr:dipeptide ABC transporter ATP-binding protein [Streptomyces radicis]RKN04595.1 dipeptide ABC transporter ATP-binding protein [Streptomyces radicis]RKN15552.1 dipeptide ABC transporter ATP-binding protein [Streptomyces radicis]